MFQIARQDIQATKRILLFVEGKTEYNYFNSFKRYNNLEIKFKNIINVEGGGYTRFLKEIKKSNMHGYLAFFIIFDLDRYHQEKDSFDKLLKYCNSQNKIGNPHFLIGSNKDFELFACCHCPNFQIGKNSKSYIEKDFGFKRIDDFKSSQNIYEFLNKDNKSYKNALDKLNNNKNFIQNEYKLKTKGIDFSIKSPKISINQNNIVNQHSNIGDLFKLIES